MICWLTWTRKRSITRPTMMAADRFRSFCPRKYPTCWLMDHQRHCGGYGHNIPLTTSLGSQWLSGLIENPEITIDELMGTFQSGFSDRGNQ